MIGKKPDMNCPACGSPAKKRVRSPCTTEPSAFVKLPAWNQKNVFRNWCIPIGMSSRLATPKSAAPQAPRSIRCLANQVSASPTGCQSRPNTTPSAAQMKAIRIGTSRMAVEKPSQSTSRVRWNRCQTIAVSSPMRMPPRTPGFCGKPAGSAFVTVPPIGNALRTPW